MSNAIKRVNIGCGDTENFETTASAYQAVGVGSTFLHTANSTARTTPVLTVGIVLVYSDVNLYIKEGPSTVTATIPTTGNSVDDTIFVPAGMQTALIVSIGNYLSFVSSGSGSFIMTQPNTVTVG